METWISDKYIKSYYHLHWHTFWQHSEISPMHVVLAFSSYLNKLLKQLALMLCCLVASGMYTVRRFILWLLRRVLGKQYQWKNKPNVITCQLQACSCECWRQVDAENNFQFLKEQLHFMGELDTFVFLWSEILSFTKNWQFQRYTVIELNHIWNVSCSMMDTVLVATWALL